MKIINQKISNFKVTCSVNGIEIEEEDMKNYKVSNPVLNGILNSINRGEIKLSKDYSDNSIMQ